MQILELAACLLAGEVIGLALPFTDPPNRRSHHMALPHTVPNRRLCWTDMGITCRISLGCRLHGGLGSDSRHPDPRRAGLDLFELAVQLSVVRGGRPVIE